VSEHQPALEHAPAAGALEADEPVAVNPGEATTPAAGVLPAWRSRVPYDRMTALDASFLLVEHGSIHMHVGAVSLFELGPLGGPDGGVDFERIRSYVRARLDQHGRYRQRLRWRAPLTRPVWVDDDHFDLDYHLRHTALPRPGSIRQLKRLAGRIFSQRLDRDRPLWEFWVVEGVEGGRFALISKVHHCMIDGIAGADLLASLLSGDPGRTEMPESRPWQARPGPRWYQVLRDELTLRGRGLEELASGVRNGPPGRVWSRTRQIAAGLLDTLRTGLTPVDRTPLNPKSIGSNRRFDWLAVDLDQAKAIKNALGGTINDVVLAAVAGGARRYLSRSCDPDQLHDFRAFVPVNVRRHDHGNLGNRVAMLMAGLPVDVADPRERYQRVRETTKELKRSPRIAGAEAFEEVSDFTSSALIAGVFEIAALLRTFNVIVTNIPGPPFPLYLLGSRMHEVYPLVPLYQNQALGIALLSNAGRLNWGLVADRRSMPDLHVFRADLEDGFAELAELAAQATSDAA
jgi:diacylglycerol O-acyltransferase / wax synthase